MPYNYISDSELKSEMKEVWKRMHDQGLPRSALKKEMQEMWTRIRERQAEDAGAKLKAKLDQAPAAPAPIFSAKPIAAKTSAITLKVSERITTWKNSFSRETSRRVAIVAAGICLILLGLSMRSGFETKPAKKQYAQITLPTGSPASPEVAQPKVRNVHYKKTQGLGYVNRAPDVREVREAYSSGSMSKPKRPDAHLDGMRIVCADFGCITQYSYKKEVAYKPAQKPEPKVVEGDVEFSPRSLVGLDNLRIKGDLTIRNLDYAILPATLSIEGNLIVSDSRFIRVENGAEVKGQILVRGNSSIGNLPASLDSRVVIAKGSSSKSAKSLNGGRQVASLPNRASADKLGRSGNYNF